MESRILLVVVLFFLLKMPIGNGQQFSKTFDFDQIGRSDFFSAMIEYEENLFLIAYYQYADHNNVIRSGNKVIKTDFQGNILIEKDFPWMQDEVDYGLNMIIDNGFLYILNSYQIGFQNGENPINLLKLNLDLDSIEMKKYNPFGINPAKAADGSLTIVDDYFLATGWINIEPSVHSDSAFMLWINKHDLELDSLHCFPNNYFGTDSIYRSYTPYSFFNTISEKVYVFSEMLYRESDQNFNKERTGFLVYDPSSQALIDFLEDEEGTFTFHNSPFLTREGNLLYEIEGQLPVENEIKLISDEVDLIWNNTSIPVNPYGQKTIWSWHQLESGNIIGCGNANWHFEYGIDDPDSITTFKAPYLIKIDIETGEIIWERFIIDFDENDEVSSELFFHVIEADNGDLICSGMRRKNILGSQIIGFDSWLVRLDNQGCSQNFNCNDFSFLSTTNELQNENFKIYPNPTSDFLHVESMLEIDNIIIRNIQGQQVIDSNQRIIDIKNLVNGIYLISFVKEGSVMNSSLFIKI